MADKKEISITIVDTELKGSGFTDAGIQKYKKTVSDYAQLIFMHSVALGTAKKLQDNAVEITQDNVQASAYSIADSYGKPSEPKWTVWTQILEYILTAVAGLSAGKTDTKWGTIAFIASTAVAVILFVIRQTRKK